MMDENFRGAASWCLARWTIGMCEWLKDGGVVYTYIPNHSECIIDISTDFELGRVRNKKMDNKY